PDAGQGAIDQLEHQLGCEVEPHQPVAARPVDRDRNGVAHAQAVRVGERVPDVDAALLGTQDGPAADRAGHALLGTRFRVEDRVLDGDRRAFDRGDARVERRRVGVDPELLAGHLPSLLGNGEVPTAATGTDGAARSTLFRNAAYAMVATVADQIGHAT